MTKTFQQQCDEAQDWADLYCPQDEATQAQLMKLVKKFVKMSGAEREHVLDVVGNTYSHCGKVITYIAEDSNELGGYFSIVGQPDIRFDQQDGIEAHIEALTGGGEDANEYWREHRLRASDVL